MGIQINGNNDTISAADGGIVISGSQIDNANLVLSENLKVSGIGTFGNGLNVTGGSVGIGTDNPISELMVENATQSHITVKTSGSNMAKFGSKGNDVYVGGTAGAASIIFKRNIVSTDHPADSGTETLRIDSSGNIGIGTNTVNFSQFGSNTGGVAIQDIGGTNTGIKLSDGNYHNYLVQAGNSNLYLSHYGSGGDIIFGIGSSGEERAKITSGGNVQIANGNLVFSTAGTGIDFSATSDATGMSSELLDDYEEGTWTPVLEYWNGSSWVSLVFGTSPPNTTGLYTKIGNKVSFVYYTGGFTISSGNSQQARIRGLPYNSISSNNSFGHVTYTHTNCFAVAVDIGYIDTGASFFVPLQTTATSSTNWTASTSTVWLMVNGFYTTA